LHVPDSGGAAKGPKVAGCCKKFFQRTKAKWRPRMGAGQHVGDLGGCRWSAWEADSSRGGARGLG